jgi:hypothetical protein
MFLEEFLLGNTNVNKKNGNNKKRKKKPMSHRRWILIIVVWSIIISAGTNLLSETLLNDSGILVAFIILIVIILIGVLFDTIGTAVTAANEVPFHAMASKRINGAKTAINLIRNADKVSNFCNDVIGDICGIVSGSAGLIIVKKLTISYEYNSTLLGAGIGALIAATTIGGKALGKNIAINYSNKIIFEVAKIIHIIKKDR